MGRERSRHFHHPAPMPLDLILTEAEFFPGTVLYRILPQALVLTVSKIILHPFTTSGWGDDGFSHYYMGSLCIPHP